MKTTLIIMLFISITQFASAAILPLKVVRQSNGKIDRIEILEEKKIAAVQAEEFYQGLAIGFEELGKTKSITFDGAHKLKLEEQATLFEAMSGGSTFNSKTNLIVNHQQINQEFVKTIFQLHQKKWFALIASPQRPKDFDEEAVLVELIKKIVDEAKSILGSTPAFSIFSFMVDEFVNALIARREFFQNALLAHLNSGKSSFTSQEAALIKSSIFYSRMSLLNLPARTAAIKNWNKFGMETEAKWLKKCEVQESTYLQGCFKVVNEKVRNILVQKHSLTSASSLTFEVNQPTATGKIRWMILAVKLGVKLTPAPGIIKSAVNGFLTSFYAKQRTSEGLLYGMLMAEDRVKLANALKGNNANPTF